MVPAAIVAAVLSMFAIVLIAWPAYILMKRYRQLDLPVCVSAGTVIGLIVGGILWLLPSSVGLPPARTLWPEMVGLVAAGPLGALVFWLVVRGT